MEGEGFGEDIGSCVDGGGGVLIGGELMDEAEDGGDILRRLSGGRGAKGSLRTFAGCVANSSVAGSHCDGVRSIFAIDKLGDEAELLWWSNAPFRVGAAEWWSTYRRSD